MNGNIRQLIFSLLALLAFIVLPSGCDDSSTNPCDIQSPTFRASGISDIIKIVWTLNKSAYEPFYLVYDEDRFFGYDGCNWFGGVYEARNDSIFPREVAQTERACNVSTFSIQHLAEPYRIEITQNELRIVAQRGTFTYKSDVTDSIENSPLIRDWMLTASTDPEFAEIHAQQLIPLLSLDGNRGFRIAWYCVPDNTFGCDEIFGIFGIGAGGKIIFYKTGWRNHAQGLDFMERILNSSSYSVEADTLTLVNESNGTSFEFSAISRSSQQLRAHL